MSHYKTILALGITLLLLAGTLPALAATPQTTSDDEAAAFQTFFNKIDTAAATSHSLPEFLATLNTLAGDKLAARYPALQSLLTRVRTVLNQNPNFYFLGIPLGATATGRTLLANRPTSHFVLSYGAYHRLNPFKHNTLTIMKNGLTLWHYRTQSLLRGHTLILNRHPFGIGQRIIGSQLGFMTGFRGIYWDHESRLTGNTYLFFMGIANRIHTFDLRPFQ